MNSWDIQFTYRNIKKILEPHGLDLETHCTHAALFNSKGFLVHSMGPLPLHCFGFSQSIQNLLKYFKLNPGDVVVTNDPAFGSPRLCDIQFFKPIFAGNDLRGFTAIQVSHTGLLNTPKLLEAKTIEDEGFKIPPTPLDFKGEIQNALLTYLGGSGINAELLTSLFDSAKKSLEKISQDYLALEKKLGKAYVTEKLQALESYTEGLLQKNLHRFPDGEFSEQVKFNHNLISTRVKVKGSQFIVDFNGTTKQNPNSLNCPYPLTLSTCFWFFLKILGEEVPVNNGLFHALSVEAPFGSLLNPQGSPASLEGYYKITALISQSLAAIAKKALPDLAFELTPSLSFLFQSSDGIYTESLGAGKDATIKTDGIGNNKTDFHRLKIKSVELCENLWPLRFDFLSAAILQEKNSQFKGAPGIKVEIEALKPGKFKILCRAGIHSEEFFLDRAGVRSPLTELKTVEVHASDKIFLQSANGKDKGTKEAD